MKPGIDQGIESVPHFRSLILLRSIDYRIGYFLNPITKEYPRHEAEMDGGSWERLSAAVKFMDNLREDIKKLYRSMK